MPAATPLSPEEIARAEARECACGCGEATTPSKSYRGRWTGVWATTTCRKRAYKRRKKEGRVVSVARRARNREIAEVVGRAAAAADARGRARAELISARRTQAHAWAVVANTLEASVGHPRAYQYRDEERWALWMEYDPSGAELTDQERLDREAARRTLLEVWSGPWGAKPKPPTKPATLGRVTYTELQALALQLVHEVAAGAEGEEIRRRAEALTNPSRLVDLLARDDAA